MHETEQLVSLVSTMKSRKSMSTPEHSGKKKGRLLFYDEIRKLNVPDQTV